MGKRNTSQAESNEIISFLHVCMTAGSQPFNFRPIKWADVRGSIKNYVSLSMLFKSCLSGAVV